MGTTTFDTQNSLYEKIDRLTSMMSKLTAQDDNQNKQFKPNRYQSKILEGIWDQIRITEVRIIEVDTEEIIEMIRLRLVYLI